MDVEGSWKGFAESHSLIESKEDDGFEGGDGCMNWEGSRTDVIGTNKTDSCFWEECTGKAVG